MKYDVYISYTDQDEGIASLIAEYMSQFNIRCFVKSDFPETHAATIVHAIENSTIMLFIYSEASKNSEQIDKEIEIASESKKAILTMRVIDADFEGAKKYYLKNLDWIDAFPSPEEKLDSIVYNVAKLIDIKLPEPKGKISIICDINADLLIDGAKVCGLTQNVPSIHLIPFGEYIISICSQKYEDISINSRYKISQNPVELVIKLAEKEKRIERKLVPSKSVSLYKYGLCDEKTQELVVPYIYDNVREFCDGMALVTIGEKKGFINRLGKVIIPVIYDDAFNFHDGVALIYKGKAGALVNTKGEILTPFEFGYVYPFREGRAKARDLEYNGFIIDKEGNKIFQCEYYSTDDFYKSGKIKTEKGYRGLNGELIQSLPKGRKAKKKAKKESRD